MLLCQLGARFIISIFAYNFQTFQFISTYSDGLSQYYFILTWSSSFELFVVSIMQKVVYTGHTATRVDLQDRTLAPPE